MGCRELSQFSCVVKLNFLQFILKYKMVSSQKEKHKYCRTECFADALVRLMDTYSFQLKPKSPWHVCIIKMQLTTSKRRNFIELHLRNPGSQDRLFGHYRYFSSSLDDFFFNVH